MTWCRISAESQTDLCQLHAGCLLTIQDRHYRRFLGSRLIVARIIAIRRPKFRMPAPALYILAFVGTIGAAIAFKEFVYEPHIAPHIDRWKAEYQAARERRAQSERSTMMAQVPLLHRGPGNDDYPDDSDHSDAGSGKGKSTLRPPVQPHMKNGFLIRRRGHPETTARKHGDVELDDWITGTTTATEMASQQSDLRLRKNNGSLNESIQPILQMPLLPTTSPSRTSTRTSPANSNQMKTGHKPIELEPKKTAPKTTETDFLDEIDPFPHNQFNTPSHVLKPIQAIPSTPLSPIRTPTPTHVLSNASSTHSPPKSPFSSELSFPPPNEAPLSKLETNVAGSPFSHPLLAPLQPPSPLPRAADLFPPSSRSPPDPEGVVFQTSNMAVAGAAPLSPLNIGSTAISNSSFTPLHPLASPSPPPTLTLSSPPQLPPLVVSHTSPYQTPPHLHTIPSLSQSYPLDDLLDYERGLELLSPPSPLSRTDSPFEFAGLSPRLWIGEESTLLLARNGDRRTSRDHLSTPPVDGMTNSMRSTTYLSFSSSPARSVSSVSASSDNGYENDSSRSEMSSTFSSPVVAPARLGLGLDLGSESLSPHDQSRLGHSMSPSFSSRVDDPQRHRQQQLERSVGSTSTRRSVPASPIQAPRLQESNARRPMIAFNDDYDNYADTQTLSPRNRTQSPWMMMDRIPTGSVATASVSTETLPSESSTRKSRVDSDFDTGSELSELDFPGMSAEEFDASSPAPAGGIARSGGSVGPRSRSGMYTGGSGGAKGIRGLGIRDGNASDTSSWSFAGGSD